MKNKLIAKLLIPVLTLLLAISVIGVGCAGEAGQPPETSSTSELSSILVPNVPLDIYLYARQDSPTMLPAEMVDAPYDIGVESLAAWGVPAEDSFAFGMGLTLSSASDAAKAYDQITLEEDGWKMLSGSTIYLVHGSGTAAELLKTAISNNDFKYYDDSECLSAAARLPDGGTTRLAAIALAKPSESLIGLLSQDVDFEATGMINTVLKLVRLKVIAAGLYSPHQIDIARVAKIMENNGNIADLDLGVLLLVKSGLPGFLLKPAVGKLLTESDFTETSAGELTLYKGSWDTGDGEIVPVMVRIDGGSIFAAISGQESYAETLITQASH